MVLCQGAFQAATLFLIPEESLQSLKVLLRYCILQVFLLHIKMVLSEHHCNEENVYARKGLVPYRQLCTIMQSASDN